VENNYIEISPHLFTCVHTHSGILCTIEDARVLKHFRTFTIGISAQKQN